MDAQQAIQALYDSNPAHEWARMDRHPTEFAVTLRALAEHLPPVPARILDCGGGPGRYAIELARQGYQVTLFDLSPGNLALAEAKAQEAGVMLAGLLQGTAIDLSRFEPESFDSVLLMGPLYHLLEEEQRRQAVAEAYRVLRPGGLLCAAFITRYAAHRWAAAYQPELIVEHPKRLDEVLKTGCQPPDDPEINFVAYFADPREVAPLFWQQGFEVLEILAVEGILSRIEEGVNQLSGAAWQRWVDFNYQVASDPTLHSGADHLLAVVQKPRWRAVLRELAQQLNKADIAYKVVGSASLALHGVPLRVGDLDIETDRDEAYRIQALLQPHVVDPVAFLESEHCRSHLGRLLVDGVQVEIMGDMQRPQDHGWVSTAASTETWVDLEGVSVPISWLEEETLAYIRRGHLARAAQALVHCDRDRLLALLQGRESTAVL